ncbi:hypothetical protein GCM10011514_12210 [Emticicia aquatilis]|uniref:C1q domain-containing protein n=1 Tax=Emticicia aquatilis TaxID=1537369 RepID=A0A916YKZ2_9BACT|nr:hypothetical protein [Emticicia aquatilis]GGD49609.1 hypothetical protein GCM10011514_12210 [Emticicia aquatilis]
MKKIVSLILFVVNFTFGQSLTITPNSTTNSEVLKINKIGIGLDHRTTNNIVGVGTYVNGTFGILQTHTNHPLGFATGNSTVRLMLQTNGNFGVGMTDPQYILDIKDRVRIRTATNTAGIWFSKSTNGIDEGSFFGNINDASAGIWIGNAWRFGVNDAGTVSIASLAGTGTRPVGADASGNLVAISGTVNPAFSVSSSAQNLVLGNGSESQIYLNFENFDITNSFDNSNYYQFTAPSNGVYHFTLNVAWQGNVTGKREIILRNQNTTYLASFFSYPPNNQMFLQNYSVDLNLTAGTSVRVYVSQDSGTNLNIYSAYKTIVYEPIFSGFKIN